MAALTTLNITEKNANNSWSVTAKVNVTKEYLQQELNEWYNIQSTLLNFLTGPGLLRWIQSI